HFRSSWGFWSLADALELDDRDRARLCDLLGADNGRYFQETPAPDRHYYHQFLPRLDLDRLDRLLYLGVRHSAASPDHRPTSARGPSHAAADEIGLSQT